MDQHEHNLAHEQSAQAADDEARMDAARTRLRGCNNQKDALEAIREIVANLLGSEEMALFTVDRKKAVLWLYWSFGIDASKHPMLDALSEPALQMVMEGEAFVESKSKDVKLTNVHHQISAYVPVRFAGETVAVLAIHRLLPQKTAIDRSDLELFKVISEEAGEALYRISTPTNRTS